MASSDVAIIGAGPLGLACAIALARNGVAARLYDAQPAPDSRSEARILALSQGSRTLLESLGAWPGAHATTIGTIHISQQGHLGRSLITAQEEGVPALGYVVAARHLAESLRARAQALAIPIEYGVAVEALHAERDAVTLTLAGARHTSARLALCCEGHIAEAATRCRDYQQHALLCRARLDSPHQHVAFERFRQQGPLALLPYGDDYAVVWAVPAADSAALLEADSAVWRDAIQHAMGTRVRIRDIAERACYPLELRVRQHIVAARQVWLGNAAQTLHPVAGQGFNLALRDVWTLAQTVAGQADPGRAEVLRTYQAARKLDRSATIGFTDGLARLFSADLPGLGHLRGAGLLALDALPPLRHFLARRLIFGARAWP